MKKFMLGLALVLFAAPMMQAQVTTSVEVLPIGTSFDHVMITPDYFTMLGEVTLYGFVEYSGEGGGWFADQSATWMTTKHVGFAGEASTDNNENSRSSFGPAFKPSVPGFASLTILPTVVFGTPDFDRELKIVWRTNDFAALGGVIWSEGFVRTLRNNGAHTYGQPQVWWRKSPESTWHFGVEAELFGADWTFRGGFRKVF
ncbi:MAG: hypothetical protein KBB78_03290 [Candidatus Pacebacteria bacterium]|nr:hypothetical protein [Candidatus Paceibacterota bacterium]